MCLRDEPTAPTRWPLARIVNVYPGEDGKVRVVTVKLAKGYIKGRGEGNSLCSRRKLEKNHAVLAGRMLTSVYEDVYN